MSGTTSSAATEGAGTAAAAGVLAATCLSTFVVNANTSAVSILLPAISADMEGERGGLNGGLHTGPPSEARDRRETGCNQDPARARMNPLRHDG